MTKTEANQKEIEFQRREDLRLWDGVHWNRPPKTTAEAIFVANEVWRGIPCEPRKPESLLTSVGLEELHGFWELRHVRWALSMLRIFAITSACIAAVGAGIWVGSTASKVQSQTPISATENPAIESSAGVFMTTTTSPFFTPTPSSVDFRLHSEEKFQCLAPSGCVLSFTVNNTDGNALYLRPGQIVNLSDLDQAAARLKPEITRPEPGKIQMRSIK